MGATINELVKRIPPKFNVSVVFLPNVILIVNRNQRGYSQDPKKIWRFLSGKNDPKLS